MSNTHETPRQIAELNAIDFSKYPESLRLQVNASSTSQEYAEPYGKVQLSFFSYDVLPIGSGNRKIHARVVNNENHIDESDWKEVILDVHLQEGYSSLIIKAKAKNGLAVRIQWDRNSTEEITGIHIIGFGNDFLGDSYYHVFQGEYGLEISDCFMSKLESHDADMVTGIFTNLVSCAKDMVYKGFSEGKVLT